MFLRQRDLFKRLFQMTCTDDTCCMGHKPFSQFIICHHIIQKKPSEIKNEQMIGRDLREAFFVDFLPWLTHIELCGK